MMALREHARGLALAELLDGIAPRGAVPEVRVTGIGLDSRTLQSGDLFCALPGTVTSGARFLAQAARAGAAAALVDAGETGLPSPAPLPLCAIDELRGNAGRIAARFFGEPTHRQQVVGVTGTNGKTSVTHFIASALDGWHDRQAAVIGTLGSGRVGELHPGNLTTPDPVELQRLFAALLERGIETVAMEVSSHALAQQRVGGVRFCCAVFRTSSAIATKPSGPPRFRQTAAGHPSSERVPVPKPVARRSPHGDFNGNRHDSERSHRHPSRHRVR